MGLISVGGGRLIVLGVGTEFIASLEKHDFDKIELNRIILIFILYWLPVRLLGFAYGFGILMQISEN